MHASLLRRNTLLLTAPKRNLLLPFGFLACRLPRWFSTLRDFNARRDSTVNNMRRVYIARLRDAQC